MGPPPCNFACNHNHCTTYKYHSAGKAFANFFGQKHKKVCHYVVSKCSLYFIAQIFIARAKHILRINK